jgi:formylglycine-generating enzyme required for sulfatase activity
VLLAVIGPRWLPILTQRREEPLDFVRLEIEAALQRRVPIIPTLVSGALMPGAGQLPPSLQELAFRNALEVRRGRDFHRDVDRLLSSLDHWLQDLPEKEVVNSVGMKLAWIPPGTFLMGSPEGEEGRHDDEIRHRVALTKGFYLGVHQVTQAQWQAVMGSNPSKFKGGNLPVECVSWDDCQDYRKKLAAHDGKPYRLPTEAEWEYACRAGTTTPFHFGETISTDQANFDGHYTYGRGEKGVYREKTTPVGRVPPNAWGLFDMHGNVCEWCQDWYGGYPKEDIKDYSGPNRGTARVLRGGSWGDRPVFCRSAFRGRIAPSRRYSYYGCRLVFCPD